MKFAIMSLLFVFAACGTEESSSLQKSQSPASANISQDTDLALDTPVRSQSDQLQTVASVDIERYLGKWYEVASIPKWFQWRCVAAEAEYSLNDDGTIRVDNRCRRGNVEGSFRTIRGKAEPVDETNAKLEVTFWWLLKGDYWIIELDEDYQYAVVGDPKRNSLWILSRTRQISEALYADLLERIEKKHGYDPKKIKMTTQPLE